MVTAVATEVSERGLWACRLTVRSPDDAATHPHDLFMAMVSKQLDRCRRTHWLDAGCGWHFDWRWEHDRERAMLSKADVIGLDPDWRAVSKHRSITRLAVGKIENLPFATASFDLVTANVVVEHLKYPSLAFAEAFRVLKPGGCFMFRTPSARSYFVRVAKMLPDRTKIWLASKVIENRDPADIYPTYYRANTVEEIHDICRLVGFRAVIITVTKVRGIVAKVPAIAGLERAGASLLGVTEGNLIAEVYR